MSHSVNSPHSCQRVKQWPKRRTRNALFLDTQSSPRLRASGLGAWRAPGTQHLCRLSCLQIKEQETQAGDRAGVAGTETITTGYFSPMTENECQNQMWPCSRLTFKNCGVASRTVAMKQTSSPSGSRQGLDRVLSKPLQEGLGTGGGDT